MTLSKAYLDDLMKGLQYSNKGGEAYKNSVALIEMAYDSLRYREALELIEEVDIDNIAGESAVIAYEALEKIKEKE